MAPLSSNMKENKKNQRPKVKVKEFEVVLLSPTAVLPKKSVRGAIGYDLSLPRDVKVPAHSRIAIPIDIAINLPYGVEGKIEPRSGHSSKGMEGYGIKTEVVKRILGIFPVKKTRSGRMRFDADVLIGKIDPNYTDNIHIILKNNDVEFTIRAGARIAQLSFYHTTSPFLRAVEKLTCKSRGGGLGHTGTDRLHVVRGSADIGNDKPLGLADCESTPNSSASNHNDLGEAVEEIYADAIDASKNIEAVANAIPTAHDHDENDHYGVHV